MGNKRIPEVRFQGFTEGWEQRKLKDISKIHDGTHQTPKYTDSGIKFVSVENINNIEVSNKYISVEDYENQFKNKPEVGDIFMTRITAGIIGATAVVEKDNPIAYYVSLALIKPSKRISSLFLNSYISTKEFKKELDKRIIHTAFPKKINLSDIGECSVSKPKKEEQVQIGNFFKQLDDNIALHQQELTTLKQTKQGFLQKMFPKEGETVPEIRFPGFTGDWEEHKLGDIAEFNPKSNLPEQFEYVDLESIVGINLISHRTEQKETAPSRAQRLAKQGDVFFQTVRPYQRNNFLFDLPFDNYVFSTGYAQMRPYLDSYFLLNRLQEERFVSNVLDRCTGTSYPAINSKDLSQIEISVPAIKEEQTKIGNFFKQLDDTIALHQRELDALKETKKAFLQKMFV